MLISVRLRKAFGLKTRAGGRPTGQFLMRSAPIVVCFPFIGDELGGSHISAIKLIEGLDPRLVTPIVALHVVDGPVAAYLADRGVPFVRAPDAAFLLRDPDAASGGIRLRVLGHAFRMAAPICRLLRKHGVDLVHTNDGRIHAVWALPTRLAGARQVWHHRGDPDAFGINLLAPLAASHIVTVSRFSRPRKPIVGVGQKLSVVYSPFDRPTATGRTRARAMLVETLGCAAETRFLAYFGLLIDRKRPIGFVEAVAALIRRYPDLPVMGLLFGVPGMETPQLDQMVMQRAEELNIGKHIRLMGFRHPIEPWMQAVDVLLVTAVREPFGRTLIEAMFLGTPVVATDDGGNREAIENGVTGFLVPPDRPECFVEPVYSMLTDAELRSRITAAASDRAFATYGVETHVGELTAIYQRLVRPRGYLRDKMEQEPFMS
ncbi:glycosyltransferase [Mesorhizobium sp. M00.F.Ca.ET.216.01.1.1]|nr:glycosyltransferase [Mesorhizobium sp. M00.F.Ca.ET.216.01.1.1]TJW14873.1 MAG: glycosyltransferase [Mesorhizobium sp.]TJW48931.1 MAG: glycosyltransferase [Mesorhizobium sp.]